MRACAANNKPRSARNEVGCRKRGDQRVAKCPASSMTLGKCPSRLAPTFKPYISGSQPSLRRGTHWQEKPKGLRARCPSVARRRGLTETEPVPDPPPSDHDLRMSTPGTSDAHQAEIGLVSDDGLGPINFTNEEYAVHVTSATRGRQTAQVEAPSSSESPALQFKRRTLAQ